MNRSICRTKESFDCTGAFGNRHASSGLTPKNAPSAGRADVNRYTANSRRTYFFINLTIMS